jgi:hypothetical protein
MSAELDVYLEAGTRRTFAVAVEWPGWARSGRTADVALEALQAQLPRYAGVATAAGLDPPGPAGIRVVETLSGGATTDFGALSLPCRADQGERPRAERERWVAILEAGWRLFEEALQSGPEELRKGPRGGGRESSAIRSHVEETEWLHAAGMGVQHPRPASVADLRAAIIQGLLAAEGPFSPVRRQGMEWTPLFAARRSAWHVLDHLWEVEDRS